MQAINALAKLARLDSSLLIFLAVFVPILARTGDFYVSAGMAVPILFIAICTFICNDLDDLESDRINHPKRPLPSGEIHPPLAVLVYFILLAFALFSIRHFVKTDTRFLYLALLLLAINYVYIEEHTPNLKPFYVSIVSSMPVLIVADFYPRASNLYPMAVATILLVLGRELCMDYVDKDGDHRSFVHILDPRILALIAFSVQVLGIGIVVSLIKRPGDIVAAAAIAALNVMAMKSWLLNKTYRDSIFLMKAQVIPGLYFLA